jgi:glycosyltransferase involved in cell wall biosynthesis
MLKNQLNKDEPLVSVITNSFNSGAYIRTCVASVLSQNYNNWEHIVVDCGSNDNTIKILSAVAHERLRVLEIPVCGVGVARNIAIGEAKGEIIAILDSDDVCFPDRINLQVKALIEDGNLVAVGSSVKCVYESNKREKCLDYPASSQGILMTLQVGINTIPHSSLAFRLSCFKKLSGYLGYMEKSEDFDLLLRMTGLGLIKSIQIPLVKIAIRGDSHTSVHRPRGRDANFYVALSIILFDIEIQSDEMREKIEAWLDNLGERGVNNFIWWYQFKFLCKNISKVDMVTTLFFLRSLISRFHISLLSARAIHGPSLFVVS